MTTEDKHCQTLTANEDQKTSSLFTVKKERSGINRGDFTLELMYDETVVVNANEIESSSSSESGEGAVKAAMAKFNPPVRHTSKHDFDSESETGSENERFLDNLSGDDLSPGRDSQKLQPFGTDRMDKSKEVTPPAPKTPKESARSKAAKRKDSSNSETDSAEIEAQRTELVAGSGRRRGAGVVIPAEGAYDPKQFQDLKVPADIENLFQYILKYTPQKIDIDFKLAPFIPEYVPAVGDIDAFIKVSTPACNARNVPLPEPVLAHIDNLGLTVLDEPAAEQSDSALLHLQLRAISKTSSAKSTVLTKKIENAEKNTKAIDRWIKDVSELHLSKPAPTVTYTNKMPDIDSLMEEWPETVEEALNEVGFPPPTLDCTLSQYVDLVCGLFDIPVGSGALDERIQALHLLFSLYAAVRSSQLYADREKEKANTNI